MGLTAERVAKHYGISGEEADAVLLRRAIRRRSPRSRPASSTTKLCQFRLHSRRPTERATAEERTSFKRMKVRAPTPRVDALGKAQAVFHAKGVVTAGNSSQTSDGAAAAVVMSANAPRRSASSPLARFVSFSYAGCEPEEMGIGPVHAIPKALKLAGLNARRHRSLRTQRGLRRAVARCARNRSASTGEGQRQRRRHRARPPAGLHRRQAHRHPCAKCTAAKSKYGMVTMCVGGGMGAAGIFENLNFEVTFVSDRGNTWQPPPLPHSQQLSMPPAAAS